MAKICDLCGCSIGWGEAYYRRLGDTEIQVCDNCSFQLAGLIAKGNPKKTGNSVKWAKDIISKGKYKPDVYKLFNSYVTSAESSLEGETPADAAADNNEGAQGSAPAAPQNVSYSSRPAEDSSSWTSALKIIAGITVILAAIIGAAVGGMLGEFSGGFLGFFGGLLVGAISACFLMVLVGIAEDIKATREYAYQIRNMLENMDEEK